MSIRIMVNGALGKMGKATTAAIQRDAQFELVGESERSDNLKEKIQSHRPQVVVDFTNAKAVFENTKTIIEADVHPVIGTSGLLPEQINTLKEMCDKKKLGGIIAPNFCIAVLLMMRFAQQAAAYFPQVEIIETHHAEKLDAPSATAIKTAEMIAEARKKRPEIKKVHETLPHARGALKDQVPIHSIRLQGFLAQQQVIFGDIGGHLIISQETIDREAFMPGVILACKNVTELKTLVYGLEHFLT